MTEEPPKMIRNRWKWLIAFVVVATLTVILREASTSAIDRARSLRPGMSRTEVHRVMGPIAHRFREGRTDGNVTVDINADCYTADNPAVGYLEEFGLLPRKPLSRIEYPIEIQYDRSDRVILVRLPRMPQ